MFQGIFSFPQIPLTRVNNKTSWKKRLNNISDDFIEVNNPVPTTNNQSFRPRDYFFIRIPQKQKPVTAEMVFQLCKLSRSLAENKCTRFNVKRSKFNKRRHSASGLCSKYTRESAEDFRTSVDFSSILCTFENTFNSYQDPIRIYLKTLNFLSPVSFDSRRGSIFSPQKSIIVLKLVST